MNSAPKQFSLTGVSLKNEIPINWHRTVGRLSLSAALVSFMLLIRPGYADQLVAFDFSRDLTTTQRTARITAVTPLQAVLSTARQDGFTESARANFWHLASSTNYFRFSFAVEAGYVADIEGVQFDSMSQKRVSTTNGPTQYNVSIGVNGAAFESVSGGWQTMADDGVWHRGVAATHGGVTLSNLTGYVTVTLAAKGANGEKSRWYVDNLMVNGRIRPRARLPVQPQITALAPRRTLRFSGLSPDQYYSVQYATSLTSDWEPLPGAVNLTTGGGVLSVDITGIAGPSLFLRGATSFDRLPTVDLGGFWRVTSTNSPFGNGVIRFDQAGTAISFEQSLVGRISDNAFEIGENGADWMSGSVTGDTLNVRCAVPLAGMASTGVYQAVRYNGPMYDVWQGTNALTASQYNNPGANGYTRIGQSSATTTFAISQPYLVVCANTLAPIDALVGPDGAFVDAAIVSTILTTNTTYPEQMYGVPDGKSAWVGSTYSGDKYRGYAAFGPVSWTSLTVHIGVPQVPADEPPGPYRTNLLAQVFYLEYDSDGSSPVADAEIALMFEPNGVAQVYAALPDYATSYRGSYSYTNGQLSLKFNDEDFYPDVKFALDLTSPKVNMPFDVFTSGTPGPSRWRRENASISHNVLIVFQGVTVNEQLSIAEGLGRARAYAEALVQPDTAPGTLRTRDGPPDDGRILIETGPLANGVRLKYRLSNGTLVCGDVLLFGRSTATDDTALTPSTLFYDPRVHLNVTSGTSGADDPSQKWALLVSSFYTRRVYVNNPSEAAGSYEEDQAILGFSDIEQKLASRGYYSERLTDQGVSVENLIHKMLSPGVLYISTHGGSDGLLATGTYLGTGLREDNVMAEFERLKNRLRDAGYSDLLTYQDEGRSPLEIAWVPNGKSKDYNIGMIGVTPAFWSWLRSKGTDFGSSLVYIAACNTSKAPALRNAIRARALFSYDGEIAGRIIGAVGRYLVDSLARRSHTAEETYYNILRVLRTRQTIYTQDLDLNDISRTVADHLHGYVTLGPSHDAGPNGILEYTDCGWLKAASAGAVDAGDVWWLLFAGRWDENAQSGAIGIFRCWDLYWSQSKSPTMGDWCVNCDPGTITNQDEVAYATYLLTGKPVVPFSQISAPRWTLNDGASP